MINITIPDIDLTVSREQWGSIPKDKQGIYFLYGSDDELLYVGQAKDLRSRVYQHFHAKTHTFKYSHLFKKCLMFYEENQGNRSIYEIYIIDRLKPSLNIDGVRNEVLEAHTEDKKKIKKAGKVQCFFIKNDGTQCRGFAHSNGLCRVHGGNGITRKKIMEQALEKYMQES